MGGFDSPPFSSAYWDFVGDYMVIGWQSTNFSDNEGASWFGPIINYEVQSEYFKKIVSHGDIAIGVTLQNDLYFSDGDFHQWEPFATNLPEPLNISDLVSVGGKLFMVNNGDNYISEDDGLTWTNVGSVPQFSNYRMLVHGDLIFAHSPYVILFEHLVSSDFGETWAPLVGNGLPASLSDAKLYTSGDMLYLVEDGEIFASTDNGNNFISLTNGALNYPGSDVPNFINGFDANGNNLFVKSNDDIIFSPDHGETWINILDNLPNEDMNGARISAQEDGLYLLYQSSQISQPALWKRSYSNFGLHTSTINVTLCAGDEYDGVVYNTNATLTDTLVLPDYDSITITNIMVLPVYEEIVQLELEQGSLFNNIPIYSDTVFVENLVAINGCDSTVITEISMLTNTSNWLKQHLNLAIFPNPSDGAFYLKYTLPNVTELEISVLDLNGKVVQTLLEKQKNKAGEYTLNVNSRSWTTGVYFIYFLIDGENYGVKVERL